MSHKFVPGTFVVYPAHGVGRLLDIEHQEISGFKVELLVVFFEKEKMTLRIPVAKAERSGLRPLSTKERMAEALGLLKIRTRAKKAMWSRRAQEYETKINSGDPVAIAEVVRDLNRPASQGDQSYSERQIFQVAIERLIREFAAIEEIDELSAQKHIEEQLKAA